MGLKAAALILCFLGGCTEATARGGPGNTVQPSTGISTGNATASPFLTATTQPQKLLDIHAPGFVNAGRPFAVYVDYNGACSAPPFSWKVAFDVDLAGKAVKVNLLLTTPIGAGGATMTCPAVFLPTQMSTSLTLDQVGIYQLTATGYNQPLAIKVEVVAPDRAVPVWTPPPVTQLPPS
jgi:hypothetical protein